MVHHGTRMNIEWQNLVLRSCCPLELIFIHLESSLISGLQDTMWLVFGDLKMTEKAQLVVVGLKSYPSGQGLGMVSTQLLHPPRERKGGEKASRYFPVLPISFVRNTN